MSFESRRLHLLGIALVFLKTLKDLFLPLLLFLVSQVFQRGYSPFWLLTGGVGVSLLLLTWGFLSWYRFIYYVKDGALIVEQGVLAQKRSIIPRTRIQAIDLNQGILHRLFNIVSVRVETAGGNKPEATLVAVSRHDANALRHALTVYEHKEGEYEEARGVSKTLSFRELFMFGATSGGALGLVLSIFSGAWALLDDVGLELDWLLYFSWVGERINPVFLIILVIFILWLLATLGVIFKYGRFTVSRHGNRIQMTYGLLQRTQVSIPVRRIQAVRMVEGILRQPLGYFTIQLENAGYGMQSAEKAILWPLARPKELIFILQEFLPEFNLEASLETTLETTLHNTLHTSLERLPQIARRRYALRSFFPVFLVSLPVFIWLPWGKFAVILPFLGVLWGLWKFHDAGWILKENMLVLRCRSFARTTVIVPSGSIQSFAVGSNPFQRRADLVSFSLELASKSHFGLADIPVSVGIKLIGWLRKDKRK
ncbi:MAG: hypothetical protein FH756_04250 [Firmicutes bacterium]|nr:hypothetical protein [Bacillota bacterium]